VRAYLEQTWNAIASTFPYENAQSHPWVRVWRERFKALGISPKEFPSSIEALLRRALKRGQPPFINPLVDLYNAISLAYVVPVGGFDIEELVDEHLELRLTREQDSYLALDAQEPVSVPPGEVAYTNRSTVLTRHFVWRQAKIGLIQPTTMHVILVSEILPGVGDSIAQEVKNALATRIQQCFHAQPETAILQADCPVLVC
jgi:DNA/RNA-binding domain of Phe-tRNA-synthetase-like protein